jgi:hypothetical protein
LIRPAYDELSISLDSPTSTLNNRPGLEIHSIEKVMDSNPNINPTSLTRLNKQILREWKEGNKRNNITPRDDILRCSRVIRGRLVVLHNPVGRFDIMAPVGICNMTGEASVRDFNLDSNPNPNSYPKSNPDSTPNPGLGRRSGVSAILHPNPNPHPKSAVSDGLGVSSNDASTDSSSDVMIEKGESVNSNVIKKKDTVADSVTKVKIRIEPVDLKPNPKSNLKIESVDSNPNSNCEISTSAGYYNPSTQKCIGNSNPSPNPNSNNIVTNVNIDAIILDKAKGKCVGNPCQKHFNPTPNPNHR